MKWADMQHFTPAEFICHCGRCSGSLPGGVVDLMSLSYVAKLDALRALLGAPMRITSGYRCPDHNQAVSPGTGRGGPHTTGQAADVALDRGTAFTLLQWLQEEGITGLGVQQKGDGRFLHLDDCHDTLAFWSY